jgi:hypothetical protein
MPNVSLIEACEKMDLSLVRAALAAGADPNLAVEDGAVVKVPLILAVQSGIEAGSSNSEREPVVRALLDAGAEIDGGGSPWSALCWAAMSGDEALVDFLIARGAYVNARDPWGTTIVGMAASMCSDVDGDNEVKARVLSCLERLILAGAATVPKTAKLSALATARSMWSHREGRFMRVRAAALILASQGVVVSAAGFECPGRSAGPGCAGAWLSEIGVAWKPRRFWVPDIEADVSEAVRVALEDSLMKIV